MKDFVKEIYERYEEKWNLVNLTVLENRLKINEVENFKTIARMLEMALYANHLLIQTIKTSLKDTRYTVMETSNALIHYHKEIRDGYLNMASELSEMKKEKKEK